MRVLPMVVSAAVALAASAPPVMAQAPRYAAAIDSMMSRFASGAGPGCAVGVSRDGRNELARGYGFADIANRVPIGPGTIFNVGSTSKQFVTFGILLLADDGKLSIDDDIRRYLPEVPDFGPRITIRHLMNHTSGLRDYATLLGLMGWQGGDQFDEARLLSLVSAQQKLNFAPGTRYLYSNTGYVLLATIVSRVSGKPWHLFAAERIFRPLGMASSSVRSDPHAVDARLALGYRPVRGGGWRLDLPNHDITGSTAVLTTVEDLARWAGNYESPKVGSRSLHSAIQQRAVLVAGDTVRYAAGLVVEQYHGRPLIQHGGATGGFRAQLLRFPDERLGVAVLCNAGNADPDDLARRIADRILPPPSATRPAAVAMHGWHPPEGFTGPFVDPETDYAVTIQSGTDGYRIAIGGGSRPLVPVGADRLEAGSMTVRLERAADGAVAGLVTELGDGSVTRYRKAPPPAPDAQLSKYVGGYRSEELDRTWWIAEKDGKLWVRRVALADVALEPRFEDGYAAPGFIVRFLPEGLRVSAGRAYGIEFSRVEDRRP